MTEQKYIKLFVANYWKTWVLTALIGLVLGAILANQLKPSFEGAISFQLSRPQATQQATAPFYLYDGYYNEQAAILARTNFLNWVTTPRAIYDIYKGAGYEDKITSTSKTANYLKPGDTNITTSTAVLTYHMPSREAATKLGGAVVTYVANNYKVDGLMITGSDPLVLETQPKRVLTALAIAIALTFAAMFISLLLHFFRSDEK
ncbi:MAG TPA: hypothetical protein VGE59_03420 [Patescibacteria group bacterium]